MIIRLFISILIFTLATNSDLMANSTSPPATNDRISVDATLKKDPASKLQIGKFVAELEMTTLDEIRAFLGAGSIEHSGDAASSRFWLCYSLPGQRVWFISHGEMGGSKHVLTQVQVISTKGKEGENVNCPILSDGSYTIKFDFGWIGTTKASLINFLGQPSGEVGNTLMFLYQDKKKETRNGEEIDWDVLGYVEVIIENNKILSINASHVTAN